jgi:hypothetical protein
MGLQGVARVKGGAYDEGIEIIRAGLSLALEHELTVEAAEVYQRLGTAHEIAGNYGGARHALGTAIGLCESGQAGDLQQVCLSMHGIRTAAAARALPRDRDAAEHRLDAMRHGGGAGVARAGGG